MSPMIEAVSDCSRSAIEIDQSAQMKRGMIFNKGSNQYLKARGLLEVSIYSGRLPNRRWHNFEAVPRHSMINDTIKTKKTRQCLYNAMRYVVHSKVGVQTLLTTLGR